MDPTFRLDNFRDGMKSAAERQSKWDSLTDEQKGFHREQMKFLHRQFLIVTKEIAEFFACVK
jgi:hypothetical protein